MILQLLWNSSARRYSTALMRDVSSNLCLALSSTVPKQEIDLHRAKQQHDNYHKLLKSIVPNVIHIDSSEKFPDCVFVEDTAIVVDNKAVITRIGAESRRDEVDAVKEHLANLGMEIYDMRDEAEDGATCDGGDVLYPVCYDGTVKVGGDRMFVGISSRTNLKGFEYLSKVFDDLQVIPVHMNRLDEKKALHLKSVVTHLDHCTLLLPRGSYGDQILQAIQSNEKHYTIIRLPEMMACNVVSVNGHVIAQETISDESKLILEKEVIRKRGMKLTYVDASEFAKCDGAMTCKSVLLP